jgi:hypothetical protein
MGIRYLKGIVILFTHKKKIPRRPAMSNLSIAPYFPFPRIRLTHQFAFPQSPCVIPVVCIETGKGMTKQSTAVGYI